MTTLFVWLILSATEDDVATAAPLTLHPSGLGYSSTSDTLYTIAWDGSSESLYSVDPSTGAITMVCVLPDIMYVLTLGVSIEVDDSTNTIYIIGLLTSSSPNTHVIARVVINSKIQPSSH